MKKNIEKTVQIPEGYQVELNGNEVVVKHQGKENKKVFVLPDSKMSKVGQEIKIVSLKASKKQSKLIGTAVAHIKNMFSGMNEEFEYKLEVCNVHFPMVLKVEGNKLVIKNFLGETVDRVAEIVPRAKVEVKGNIVTVKSHDREAAGQTSANIEIATKIRCRDRRIFQDGIFMIEKTGRRA